jgi:hypothetical protein
MQTAVKYLGNTDDVTTCECCGRADLKSTVALSFNDGEPVFFGVVCAARALATTSQTVRAESRKADRERARREAAEQAEAFARTYAPWFAFLLAHGTGAGVFEQIQSLGGHKAAWAAYHASAARQ